MRSAFVSSMHSTASNRLLPAGHPSEKAGGEDRSIRLPDEGQISCPFEPLSRCLEVQQQGRGKPCQSGSRVAVACDTCAEARASCLPSSASPPAAPLDRRQSRRLHHPHGQLAASCRTSLSHLRLSSRQLRVGSAKATNPT